MIAAAPLPTLSLGPVTTVVVVVGAFAWLCIAGTLTDRWRARCSSWAFADLTPIARSRPGSARDSLTMALGRPARELDGVRMTRAQALRKKTIIGPDGTRTVIGKRANGDGSVYWDSSKERWKATFVDPSTGRLRTASGRTQGEAERRRTEKLAAATALSPSGLLGPSPTVGQLTDWWLDRVMDVRPNTANTYRNLCVHIHRHLGAVHVRDLTIERVRLLLGDLRDRGLSDVTITAVRGRLLQIAEEAVTLGYLVTNPVSKVKPPKARGGTERTVKRILTPDECRQLVVAAATHRLGAAVAMLLLMGNRSSEVLGLSWGDIEITEHDDDSRTGTATVRRGSTYTTGIGQRLDDPKTKGTAGVHILPPSVIDLLEHRRQVQAVERLEAGDRWYRTVYRGIELDMVFTKPNGSLVLSQMLYKAMQDCCLIAGVDPAHVGTHSGRRAVVTALYASGLDLGDVARHVGHANTSTTDGPLRDIAEAVGQLPDDLPGKMGTRVEALTGRLRRLAMVALDLAGEMTGSFDVETWDAVAEILDEVTAEVLELAADAERHAAALRTRAAKIRARSGQDNAEAERLERTASQLEAFARRVRRAVEELRARAPIASLRSAPPPPSRASWPRPIDGPNAPPVSRPRLAA